MLAAFYNKNHMMRLFVRSLVAVTCLATLVAPLPAASAYGASVSHHLRLRDGDLAFTYGTGGAMMLAGTVQIRVDGTTRMLGRTPCLQPHPPITYKQLIRVLHIADTNGFFSLPSAIPSSQPNVDLAWLSVSIYTTAGTKTVREAPGAVNASFDRVYRALKHLAPFTFACRTS